MAQPWVAPPEADWALGSGARGLACLTCLTHLTFTDVQTVPDLHAAGDDTPINYDTLQDLPPTEVEFEGGSFVQVVTGSSFACGLLTDGTVACFGKLVVQHCAQMSLVLAAAGPGAECQQ
jgi:hypothetical protein